MVPSIHLSDGEMSSSREDQPRPLSPNVRQIDERNLLTTPPLKTKSIEKKQGNINKTNLRSILFLVFFCKINRWKKTKRSTSSVTSKCEC